MGEKKRARCGRLAGWVGIICNILLSAGKFIAGNLSGSVSITADALNNFSDASSSLISLIGFQLSEKRPDAEHPYGHARYEYISGFVVAILIIVIGIELLRSGIERIITPQPVDFSIVSIVVMLVSIAVKFGMMIFDRSMGRRIDSKTLIAAAADSRNACIVTAIVHDYGHGRKFATVHVEMAAENDVIKSHEIIDDIERDFLREGINMLVHFDPVVTDGSATGEVRRELDRIVRLIDSRLSIHDLRLMNCGERTIAYFDVVAPKELGMNESELREEISRFAAQKYPDMRCEITLDNSFAAIPPED